jgi:predicted GNAT family acetyltransferase
MNKMDEMEGGILDNPVWNALISSNKRLAEGTDEIKYFPADIAPFVGLKELDDRSFSLLYDLWPPERVAVVVTAKKVEVPEPWKILNRMTLLQMVGTGLERAFETDQKIVRLQQEHVPQMLALTQLTNPGPFTERTIEFGNYTGLFQPEQGSDKLIAMAGHRFHPGSYVEISAVCTHPDHLGKGYATVMILHQARPIFEQGEMPFLHVRKDNEKAIKLYKNLGFVVRSEMDLNVIRK